jgi:spore maturation protein CgeB
MHILTVLCQPGWMSSNITNGWKHTGCSVKEFFYGSHMGKSWDGAGIRANHETNKQLWQLASGLRKEGLLDLIFCVIYDDVLDVETVVRLRSLGIPLVNYHVDLVSQWYRILKTGKYFDLVACAQRDHWTGLKRAEIRPYYLPMATNPPEITGRLEQGFDGVLYLGSPWDYRRVVLSELAHRSVPLRIYGNNWVQRKKDASNSHHWKKNIHDLIHYAGPRLLEEGLEGVWRSMQSRVTGGARARTLEHLIPAEAIKGAYKESEFRELVRGAAINLGFTHFRGEPGTRWELRQARLREFEIPGCGGFYLTQDCKQIRELYAVGTHLDVWENLNDLREKISYYRSQPDKRKQLAVAGREHVIKEHTWRRRFCDLLSELRIKPPLGGHLHP